MSDQQPKRESVYRITDIEYTNSQIDDKIIGIFRFESSGEKKHGSTLIVLAEIDGVGYVYDQLIDVVNNEAEHSRTLLSKLEQDPVTRFEKIIQNINRSVSDFLKEESTPINWSRVNLFILELSQDHLCLAGIGRLMDVFFQKQPDDSYRTFDLFGSLDQRTDIDPEKVFSNIICGDIRIGDILMAGSKNFDRLRNELRLKERLTTLPPVTAALEIKQDLESRTIPDDFVATIITYKEADAPIPPKLDKGQNEEQKSTISIEKLRRTEQETLRHLAPSLTRKESKTHLGEPSAPRIGQAHIASRVIEFIRNSFRRQKVKDVASMVNLRGMHAGFGSFLTKRKKLIVILVVVLTVASIAIGYSIKRQRTLASERAAWNSTYDQAKALIEQAEGEAVYSEEKARRTLAQGLNVIDSLDTETTERREAISNLTNQVEGVRLKLQRLVPVAQPTEIFRLADGIASGALLSPILFDGKLVLADRANEQIVAIQLDTKAKTYVDLPSGNRSVKSIAAGRSSVIVTLEDRTLLAANLANSSVSTLSFGTIDGEGEITDVLTYANRLYVLDAKNKQIWRHASISGGFGNGETYVEATSADLSKSASLAIDSNVYILLKDGTVARYASGGQDGFSLPPIDPPLTNGNHIWTDAESDYILIADQIEKRVVVFTKEGRLVAQYVSPLFEGPTDITVNPQTKSIYVVDGNRVFELLLP